MVVTLKDFLALAAELNERLRAGEVSEDAQMFAQGWADGKRRYCPLYESGVLLGRAPGGRQAVMIRVSFFDYANVTPAR